MRQSPHMKAARKEPIVPYNLVLVPGPKDLRVGLIVFLTVFSICAGARAQSSTGSNAAASNNAQTGSNGSPGTGNVVPLSGAGAAIPGSGSLNTAFPSTTPAAASGGRPTDPYTKYLWNGVNVNLPSPADTLDGDLFGYRQKLADDYGIGYIGNSIFNFYDNTFRHDHHGTQTYNGQKPTAYDQNFLALTFDLSRYGIPDGQIVAAGVWNTDSWNAGGPTSLSLGTLSYYQTFFNKRLEFKVGLLQEKFEYLGQFTGGSLTGGIFGPSGSLFAETGGSSLGIATYGMNITGHITENVYDKFGIARGVSPNGVVLEHNYNPSGLRFSTPNTGAWIIDELGYLRPAAPGVFKVWWRGGGVYSAGHYIEDDHPSLRSNKNYLLYLLADRQFLQISRKPGEAYRGLYAGFTIEYVPPNLNTFSQYYEARVYGLGLLPHRPRDQISLVLTDSVFSNFLYGEAKAAHSLAHTDTKAITGSYSFNVARGVFLNAALTYTSAPTAVTYTGTTGSALNVIGGAGIFW